MCRSVADKAKLRVTDEEIDNISVSNLGFVYDGKGTIFFAGYSILHLVFSYADAD